MRFFKNLVFGFGAEAFGLMISLQQGSDEKAEPPLGVGRKTERPEVDSTHLLDVRLPMPRLDAAEDVALASLFSSSAT